jgi:hypothetical protein
MLPEVNIVTHQTVYGRDPRHHYTTGLFYFCRTRLNRPVETGFNQQVAAGRNQQKVAET